MRDGDDSIMLTEREREALAGLAQSIEDPWLAGQLAGRDNAAARPRRERRWPAARAALIGWIGLVLVVAGGVLAAATFMHSTVVASVGLAVMGVGVWRLSVDRNEAILGRLRAGSGWRPGDPHSRQS